MNENMNNIINITENEIQGIWIMMYSEDFIDIIYLIS